MEVLDARVPREKRGADYLCFHSFCYIPAQRQVLPSPSGEHNPSTALMPPKGVEETCGNRER